MSVSTTTPPLSTAQMQQYEYHAKNLRGRAGVMALEPFDPFEYLEVFGVIAKYPNDFDMVPDELLEAIEQHSAKDWSAISDKLPNDKLFVLLNPNQTRERMNVTLLEEIAHQHFGHEKTVIGIGGRQKYNAAHEQEARFTAAAALLPGLVIARTVFQRKSPEEVAQAFGTSVQLYEMRVKTMLFWDQYQQYRQAA